MKDTRTKLQLYFAAVKRLYMWNFMGKQLKLVLVTEFPKAGGTWFCQMLSDASGLPFPRNKSPKMESCIMHGHQIFYPRMYKAIAVLRDGRDIMVSAYFHFLFENDRNPPQGVAFHRRQVQFRNYDDVVENMPQFIEYMFTGYARKNRLHFSWSEFVQNIYLYQDRLCIIKYEDLLIQPGSCLERALEFYNLVVPNRDILQEIVANYSFRKQAARKPGDEDRKSFVRKGISGDWKNYFSIEACKIFNEFAGNELIQAGYEKDTEWSNPKIIETIKST